MKALKPKELSVTLAGKWQDCPAPQMAFDLGSLVYEEVGLCWELGIMLEDLPAWLADNCRA